MGVETQGIYSVALDAGHHALGFALMKRPLATVSVASIAADGNLIVDGGPVEDLAAWFLGRGHAEAFLEVVGAGAGPAELVGHRFELDEEATASVGGEFSQLVVDANSPWNTGLAPDELAGCHLAIIPHQTLDDLLPASELFGNFSFSLADQVQLLRNNRFESYYVLGDNETFGEWRMVGNVGAGSMSHLPIYPGEGIYFVRSGQAPLPVSLTFSGVVRDRPFVQPLRSGISFIAEGHPWTRSFLGRQALGNGFSGSLSFAEADQVQVPVDDGYTKYFLASDGAAFTHWVRFGGGYAPEDTAPVFDFRKAVFLRRSDPEPDYRLDPPWPTAQLGE